MDTDLTGVWFLFEALLRHQSDQDKRIDQLCSRLDSLDHSVTDRFNAWTERWVTREQTLDRIARGKARGKTVTIIRCAWYLANGDKYCQEAWNSVSVAQWCQPCQAEHQPDGGG